VGGPETPGADMLILLLAATILVGFQIPAARNYDRNNR
jgi:hypothetical protein